MKLFVTPTHYLRLNLALSSNCAPIIHFFLRAARFFLVLSLKFSTFEAKMTPFRAVKRVNQCLFENSRKEMFLELTLPGDRDQRNRLQDPEFRVLRFEFKVICATMENEVISACELIKVKLQFYRRGFDKDRPIGN